MNPARDRHFLFSLAAAALTCVAVLAGMRALDSPSVSSSGSGMDSTGEPTDASGFAERGAAHLQRVGETEDPSFYPEAQAAFEEALRLDPNHFEATAGLADYELSRHHFRRGLALSLRAREINPTVGRIDGQIADAQIELGRYGAAERTLERYGSRQPELGSYARVSYFRELNGDLPGAVAAMGLAASSAGEGSADSSFARTLLAKLEADRGNYAEAERIYRAVLSSDPAAPDANLGLAAIEAGRGEIEAAIERYRTVAEAIPAPDHLILLGEAEQVSGDADAAREAYSAAAAAYEDLEEVGMRVDTELAVFEADHGSATRAVDAGARAWRGTPSVRAADAYSWALSAAGRHEAAMRFSSEAMSLGSRDPHFLFHAGIVSLRAGNEDRARALLGRLVAQSAEFSPLFGPSAERTLERLGSR